MREEFRLTPPPSGPPERRRTRPQRGTHFLFFGIKPPRQAAERALRSAAQLRSQFNLFGSLSKVENLHVSVLSLGKYPVLTEELLDFAKQIGAGVVASPFDSTFNWTMSFVNDDPHPLVMIADEDVAEFDALLRSFWKAAALGVNPPKATPHMTLLWDHQLIPTVPLEDPISFAVEEIVLIDSCYGFGRHEHLARWRLRG